MPASPLKDLSAGLVVFLVALSLCLGVALASNAPLFAGILAGVVGGILVGARACKREGEWLAGEKAAYANEVSRRNVLRTMRKLTDRSSTLTSLAQAGKLVMVGALYDIQTGMVSFFQTQNSSQSPLPIPMVEAL